MTRTVPATNRDPASTTARPHARLGLKPLEKGPSLPSSSRMPKDRIMPRRQDPVQLSPGPLSVRAALTCHLPVAMPPTISVLRPQGHVSRHVETRVSRLFLNDATSGSLPPRCLPRFDPLSPRALGPSEPGGDYHAWCNGARWRGRSPGRHEGAAGRSGVNRLSEKCCYLKKVILGLLCCRIGRERIDLSEYIRLLPLLLHSGCRKGRLSSGSILA